MAPAVAAAGDQTADLAPRAIAADAAWDEAAAPWDASDAADDALVPDRRGWLGIAAALLLIAGWTGFFAYALWPSLARPAAPAQWVAWIGQWSAPVLLVLIAWLALVRSGRREAARYAATARLLGAESRGLEARLATMTGELALARDFLAAQGRDLDALGRIAVERVEASAGRLRELIGDNGERVDQIGTVASAALDNMEKLRTQLPVVANAAKDVTNHIGNAGRTAHVQLEGMVFGFQRLNEFGTACETHVEALRARVQGAIEELGQHAEALETLTGTRLAALTEHSEAHRQRLDGLEIEALTAIRGRFAALADELEQQRAAERDGAAAALAAIETRLATLAERSTALTDDITAQQTSAFAHWNAASTAHFDAFKTTLATLATDHAAAIGAAGARLETLDAQAAQHRAAQLAHGEALAAQCTKTGEAVERLAANLRESADHTADAAANVERTLATLEARLIESRTSLAGTDEELGGLTHSAVRLLELVNGVSEHARSRIPAAVGSAEGALGALEARVDALGRALAEAGAAGAGLGDHLAATRSDLAQALIDLTTLHEAFASESAARETAVARLNQALAQTRGESTALAGEVDQALTPAIARLTSAADGAGQRLRESAGAEIAALAQQLEEQSGAAAARVLQGRAAELIGELEAAIDHAAKASHATALAMRDQLLKVDALASNLETRVARTRERAEEQVDNDFARRAALITDQLNSTAIDIAKVLSADVGDTAWAAYLKGDRGIFTRRAVNLLESGEARAIHQHYEADAEFRAHVNRYIHDFEAMLRQVLSTRDGNALSVTLLSSDMGKLYVALAQGIERLRN